MLDETKVDETTTDETVTEEETTTDLTPDQMIEEMIQVRGGLPQRPDEEDEDFDEEKQAMKEQLFRIQIERDMEKIQRVVETKIPGSTDQQAFEVAKAVANGDIAAIVDSVLNANRHAMEIDDKDEDLKTLHVEGGGSDKKDETESVGLADLFERMADQYATPA